MHSVDILHVFLSLFFICSVSVSYLLHVCSISVLSLFCSAPFPSVSIPLVSVLELNQKSKVSAGKEEKDGIVT